VEEAEEITHTSYRPATAKLKYGKDHPGELFMVLCGGRKVDALRGTTPECHVQPDHEGVHPLGGQVVKFAIRGDCVWLSTPFGGFANEVSG